MSESVPRRTVLRTVGAATAATLAGTSTASADTDVLTEKPPVTWSRTYDPGDLIASTAAPHHGRATVYDVYPTDDGALLVGQVITRDASHGWLTAVDDAGRHQWERVFDDGAGFRAVEPATADRGGEPGFEASGALVCGSTNFVMEAPEAGARNGDPYCVRVDGEGTAEWRLTYQTDRSFGGTYGGSDDSGEIGGSGRLLDVASVEDGYVVGGHVSEGRHVRSTPIAMGLDAHGDVEWRWRHPNEERGTVRSVTSIADDVLVVGSPRGSAGETSWVARLGGDGETVWYESIWNDETDGDGLTGIGAGDGTALVAGLRERGDVGFVAVDGADGDVRWRGSVAVDGASELEDVLAVGDGYVLLGARGTEDGREAWLHSIGADGDSRWSEEVGEGRRTRGHVLTVADDGGLLVGGETTDDSTLAWLAKLGGDEPEDGSGWGLETPSLPGWATTFAVGVGVGAGLVGAASRLRRGRPTSTDAAARSSEPSASRADE
ncbi:hypothetical protein [Natronobeatus ordinarius]|uniref:hypothetical protein n=1 Tax=Natronobeatus ordinarius TaxID=2963433 RepID=UPI0020CE4558|nr:hypothetical protein [Natronobeatus ordinarius]